MASGHAAPIEITLRSSRLLALWLAALHAAAALALAAIAAPLWLRLAGLALLSWSCVRETRWHAMRAASASVVGMRLGADGSLLIRPRDGGWKPAVVVPGSALLPFVTVVLVRVAGGRMRSVVVAPDAATPEELRSLRLWLRWRADSKTSA